MAPLAQRPPEPLKMRLFLLTCAGLAAFLLLHWAGVEVARNKLCADGLPAGIVGHLNCQR